MGSQNFPNSPVIPARGGGVAGRNEVTLSDLLDASFCMDYGAIIYRDATHWQCLEPGDPGDVLTTQGPGAPPVWSPGGTVLTPSFSSFSITGQTTPIEVGTTIASGNKTFTWTTNNPGVIQANSISIVDTTASTTLASGLANTGSDVIGISAITNTSPASQVWTISGLSTTAVPFSRTFTVVWEWRVYAGTNASVTLNANAIKALSDSSGLQASFVGTYALSAANYKYLCYPDSMGDPVRFYDPVNGFLISMATVSDNAAYSNVGPGGWSYALVSVANGVPVPVTTNYRVYRSQYPLGGTLSMQVT